ncbi:MAG: CopG family transcriptional regulator [Deltaproteobacteria bacterium]|nr:CopG family transcriptional regulator [Deltaproteobacteria bacterium]
MSTFVTTNLRLPEQAFEALRLRAERDGRSVAALVRDAVEQYLTGTSGPSAVAFGADPVDALVGSLSGSSGDESVNHDAYLYGWEQLPLSRVAEPRDETAGGYLSPPGVAVPGGPVPRGRGRVPAGQPRGKVPADGPHPGGGGHARARAGGRGPRRPRQP